MRKIGAVILFSLVSLLLTACPNQGGKNRAGNGQKTFTDKGDPSEKIFPERAGLKIEKYEPPANSEEFKKYCTEPGERLVQINRPLDGYRGKTFAYQFKLICRDSSYPTVLFFSGGPGQPSTNKSQFYYPEKVNIILTDIRGVGVNARYWEEGGHDISVNTEVIAHDYVAIIESLNLKNYLIHGVSYGTMPALVVAFLLERHHPHNLPRSVVLEGPVGHPIDARITMELRQHVLNLIEDENETCIHCELDKLLGEFTPTQLGNFLDDVLSYDLEEKRLQSFLVGDLNKDLKDYIHLVDDIESLLGPGAIRAYNAVACREFTKLGLTEGMYLGEGKLDRSAQGSCPDEVIENQLNLSMWPVEKIPFYFFVGSHDTAAPAIYGERYFTEAQINKKNHICVERAGHSPLQRSLSHCANDVWEALIDPSIDLKSAIESCGERVHIDEASKCSEASGFDFSNFDHHK